MISMRVKLCEVHVHVLWFLSRQTETFNMPYERFFLAVTAYPMHPQLPEE